jgi:endonuclease/exonuclease/phosphatase family metal-dependent hydrolase
VCLQEVPVWALDHLTEWSGMTAAGDVAAPVRLGPLPSTTNLGRAITSLNHGLLRSAFSGQANAILVSPSLPLGDHEHLPLNPLEFRRREARRLRLGLVPRLAWGAERRVCQAVRIGLGDGRTALVGNLHATSYPPDPSLAAAELLRAATWIDGLARAGEVVVLAGDFNQAGRDSPLVRELAGPEWGYSAPGTGIDHVLVRGAEIEEPLRRWPDDRRRLDGRLLSDHAPVEVTIR